MEKTYQIHQSERGDEFYSLYLFEKHFQDGQESRHASQTGCRKWGEINLSF
jgi:hypothetical protein